MTEPAASLPNFKWFKVTNLLWVTLMAAARSSLLLSTEPTVTQHRRGTIRQSGKLVRELCSSFTMYAEKIIYILNHGSIMDIVIVIVIVILYSAGTYIYIMDEKSLKCDDALKDCWRNQQPKHKSLQNTTTKTHRYRTLRTFIART